MPQSALEIQFYGHDAPISIPLPPQLAAQATCVRVKSDVIEAQRHNDRRVTIGPFGKAREALTLDPCMIKGVVLVDVTSPTPAAEGRASEPKDTGMDG